MYVSGDKEGLEGDKFLFYTSTCCSSRVKYRFWREKEASPWDRETTTSTLDIPRQATGRDMLSSGILVVIGPLPLGPVLLLAAYSPARSTKTTLC